MKKRKSIFLTAALILGIGAGTGLVVQQAKADIFADIGTFFNSLADVVKDIWKKSIKFAGKTFDDVAALATYIFNNITSCIKVVSIGSEWVTKKGTYTTAKVALELVDDANLHELDPRLISLRAAETAAEIGSTAMAEILKGLSTAVGEGTNIRKFEIELGPGAENLVTVIFEGTILGQDLDLRLEGVPQDEVLDPAKFPALVDRLIQPAIQSIKDNFGNLSNQFPIPG